MSLHDPLVSCAGMPPLDPEAPPLSRFEFWPAWGFLCSGLGLGRGSGGPGIAGSACCCSQIRASRPAGWWARRKSRIFLRVRGEGSRLIPKWIAVKRSGRCIASQAVAVKAALDRNGLCFPMVAKPDIGCRGAGVRPIPDNDALGRYLADFPEGER